MAVVQHPALPRRVYLTHQILVARNLFGVHVLLRGDLGGPVVPVQGLSIRGSRSHSEALARLTSLLAAPGPLDVEGFRAF